MIPIRKSPHHGPSFDDGKGEVQFVTVCIARRQPVLASESAHALLLRAWTFADAWLVGRYVIMPDHLHFFCTPKAGCAYELRHWAKYWKGEVTKGLPETLPRPIWLRDLWDTRIRNAEHYSSKWDYVRQNPVRAGLVADPDEWPFAGELNEITVW